VTCNDLAACDADVSSDRPADRPGDLIHHLVDRQCRGHGPADIVAVCNELDAEQVHALLSAFFEHVDRIIADFGGRIDKHIGDCAMAVFGAPIATRHGAVRRYRRIYHVE
jgi:class 3 adenylate cyclase